MGALSSLTVLISVYLLIGVYVALKHSFMMGSLSHVGVLLVIICTMEKGNFSRYFYWKPFFSSHSAVILVLFFFERSNWVIEQYYKIIWSSLTLLRIEKCLDCFVVRRQDVTLCEFCDFYYVKRVGSSEMYESWQYWRLNEVLKKGFKLLYEHQNCCFRVEQTLNWSTIYYHIVYP